MKIAIVAPYLNTKGGAARFTWELSDYLSSKGDTVFLFSLFTDKKLFKEKNNLKIIDIADEKNLTQSINFWFKLGKIRNKLNQLISTKNPDIILFMNFPATLWVKKHGNTPIICYPQDINLLYTNTYIKNLSFPKYLLWLFIRIFVRRIDMERWKNFDEVICNSKFSESHISKTYQVPTKVIHLGTRTNVFDPSDNPKKLAILSVAAQKAQRSDFLIKSLENLLKMRKNFEIWIVGNHDEHEQELRKLVKSLNLTNYVKFFGRVSDAELVKLYSESLVVVHLVRQPPFGMIVTEAMSCQTPVIACHPGGTDETIVHNKTGYLINEDDGNELKKYIEKFLDEPNLSVKMGIKGRERVQEFFEMNEKNREFRDLMIKWIEKKSNS